MKNLICLSALSSVILIASCTKGDLAVPENGAKSLSPVSAPAACDSAKFVNYVLTNLTGIPSYVIAFSGPQNYTFTIPASGSTTIAVKPGTYSIYVYAPGNYSQHTFHLNGQSTTEESGARYDNVDITPCNAGQSLEISQ
ncbi:MAG TPA: hypothetical protein VGI43_03320 [Mucilaginibacter sp.]|jgi:hypothetical protein